MLLNLLRDIVNNVPSESYVSLFIFMAVFIGGMSAIFFTIDYLISRFTNK
ncbi:MAG: hypothetical protein JWO58_561 [Chitinophagaceae bacterium]|nr:hypothetical protein [Chitinophagaceae bacterium]